MATFHYVMRHSVPIDFSKPHPKEGRKTIQSKALREGFYGHNNAMRPYDR
jgi:hypothetical protein